MSGVDIEAVLHRIDAAVGRIDAALRDCGGKVGAHAPAPSIGAMDGTDSELAARNARLQAAVSGAIVRIDDLIANAGHLAGEEIA